jgi:hypothetical protein
MINKNLHASGSTGQGIQWSEIMSGNMALFQLTTKLFPHIMQLIHVITAVCISKVFYSGCHTGK